MSGNKNSGTITGGIASETSNVGGITGFSSNLGNESINNCSNSGAITGGKAGTSSTGGITGRMSGVNYSSGGSAVVLNSINSGIVTAGEASESCSTGGIVGYATSEGSINLSISNSANNGTVIGGKTDNSFTGGIAGYAYARGSVNNHERAIIDIRDCYAIAKIEESKGYVGGLIGRMKIDYNVPILRLTNSYAHTNISGNADYAGGLVGGVCFDKTMDAIFKIDECLALVSKIEASKSVKRIVGVLEGTATIDNSFGEVGNYAWASKDIPVIWSDKGAKNLDGANWDGKMTSMPISLWSADLWNIDANSEFMPTLKNIDSNLQEKIENPIWNEEVSIDSSVSESLKIYGGKGCIFIEGIEPGAHLDIYNVSGVLLQSFNLQDSDNSISISSGIYVATLGDKSIKVVVK